MKNTDPSPPVYPASMVNITNKCNLRCKHCFVFREGNPNKPRKEMGSKSMLEKLEQLQKRHQIRTMVWTPFCCYGNDVDCDLCGAWAVFYIAAKMEGARAANQG